jgi:hypothetical protein
MKASNVLCFIFGALVGATGAYYFQKQQNDIDPWDQPWQNSAVPADDTLLEEVRLEAKPENPVAGKPAAAKA